MTDTESGTAKLRQKLSPEKEAEISAMSKRGGAAYKSGDVKTAIACLLEVWTALPEPKLDWDFYSNIVPRNLMTFNRDIKDFDQALKWLDVSRESYGPGRDDFIEFYAATIWFEMGEQDKAWEEFDRQYKGFKTRPFQGEDKKYLDFYLSRKGAKK